MPTVVAYRQIGLYPPECLIGIERDFELYFAAGWIWVGLIYKGIGNFEYALQDIEDTNFGLIVTCKNTSSNVEFTTIYSPHLYITFVSAGTGSAEPSCEHSWVDTGMRMTFCRRCNADGDWHLGQARAT